MTDAPGQANGAASRNGARHRQIPRHERLWKTFFVENPKMFWQGAKGVGSLFLSAIIGIVFAVGLLCLCGQSSVNSLNPLFALFSLFATLFSVGVSNADWPKAKGDAREYEPTTRRWAGRIAVGLAVFTWIIVSSDLFA